ncbi:MAG TPA: TIR domain-containing protein [Gemmataceae bacterium]|jgi:small GTP-binding protein|nr:TIR domain-containing protein [Gemmataceae bacterium]
MAETLPFDVFLSHSHKDADIVRPLAERLRDDGLRVWFDESGGTTRDQALERSRVLVLCLSKNNSADWRWLEETLRYRDPFNKDRRIIPLRLDDAPIQESLAKFNHFNWSADQRDQAYGILRYICGAPAPRVAAERLTPAAGRLDRVLSLGHTDSVRSVAFSPDGRQALSGSSDKTVRLWEVSTGACVRVLEGHTESVYSVAWSPDGRQALSGSWDTTVRLWDLGTGQCVRVLEGHTDGVFSVAWSPDGRQALSGSGDATVRLWDVATGSCARVLKGHTRSVYCVIWSSEGTQALSGSADNSMRLWDLAAGSCVRVLEGHNAGVTSVTWSSGNRHVLSGSWDDTVRLWDMATGSCVRMLAGHTGGVYSVPWSSDGRQALSGSDDKTVRLWDVGTGKCVRVLEGHTEGVKSVAWTPDGRQTLSGANDKKVRLWDVGTGKCVRALDGHTESVNSVSWSPDGRQALSGSEDKTVRLWDAVTGRCVRVLKGHTGNVLSVSWSADGGQALSGADDKTVRLWEVETGKGERVLEGHTEGVLCVAWSPDGRQGLSSSRDNEVRLWDVGTGKCVRVLEGHTSSVWSVTWSPDGRQALSGSLDNTVRLWDVATGRCVRVLEGHKESVFSVAWSSDGRQAVSGSGDNTVRLWDVGTGRCLGVFAGHSNAIMSVAFLPDGHIVSAAFNGVWRVWDPAGLIPQVAETDVARNDEQYTNAKVLLVGDTGVGKSGLAERLVHQRFVATKSSHARKAHLLESKTVTQEGGVALHQETVLWDLAGQPAYRLVHQLSMDEAALACVLFDCRNESNPFEGAAYWSRVLEQARTNTKLKKILVASRIDVGGLPAGRERIDAFVREHGFSRFIATSAFRGDGCDELLTAIRDDIAWEQLPKVTTTRVLAALREYVGRLKGESNADSEALKSRPPAPLLSIAALHEGFVASYGEKIVWDEFLAHLQRLEDTDAVDLLIFQSTGAAPRPEDLVLLDPTRVDAYASAILVAAKDEPDGPGHLLEEHIRDGKFKMADEERLADRQDESHLLWFVMEKLLSLDLGLREQIQGKDYIVFPSQCTAELQFPGSAAFGVAIEFAGPVRNIYATLIAQLAHYEEFQGREFYQDAAAYLCPSGARYLIRLKDQGYGKGEIEVLFEGEVPAAMRQGFLDFVEKHLAAKSTPGSVTKRHAYRCIKCGESFEDRVVKARLQAKAPSLLCPFCGKKTRLVNLFAAPTKAAARVSAQIGIDAKAGKQRMTAELIINAKKAEGKFDVFLSHNSKDKKEVEKIAKQLLKKGIRPWLDKWDLAPGDTLQDALDGAIKSVPSALLFFGPADKGKWHILEIRQFVGRWAGNDVRIIPVILPGVDGLPEMPGFVGQTLWVDMRDWEADKDDNLYRLVCGILGRAPGDSPKAKFTARDVHEWQGSRR